MNRQYISISELLFEQNTELSFSELVKLKTLLEENVTGVIVTEDFADVAHNALQKMKAMTSAARTAQPGSRLQAAIQTGLGTRTGNQPKTGITNPLQKAQDFANTRASVIRNSPMIQTVSDDGVAKYFVFPDLDLSRPGHKDVFQTVLASEPNAKIIPVNDPARLAAQNSPKGVTQIQPIQSTANNKLKIQTAISNLNKVINNYNSQLNTYSFMSAEELSNLQKEISDAIGVFNNSIPKPQEVEKAEEKEMAATIDAVKAQPQQPSNLQAEQPQIAQPASNTAVQQSTTPEITVNQQQPTGTNGGANMTFAAPVQNTTKASVQAGPAQGATNLQPTNVQTPQQVSGFTGQPSNNVTISPQNAIPAGTTPQPSTTVQGNAGKQKQPQYKLKIPPVATKPIAQQTIIPKSGIGRG